MCDDDEAANAVMQSNPVVIIVHASPPRPGGVMGQGPLQSQLLVEVVVVNISEMEHELLCRRCRSWPFNSHELRFASVMRPQQNGS